MDKKKAVIITTVIVGGISLYFILRELRKKKRVLKVFDFDGTLFGSPLPNPNIWTKELYGTIRADKNGGGLCWFQDIMTLDEPYVPFPPPKELYTQSIVDEVKVTHF